MESSKAKGLAHQAMLRSEKHKSMPQFGVAVELHGGMERVNVHHGYAAHKEGKDIMATLGACK